MAKKYLSLERLTEYDALLKAEIDEKIDANKITVDDTLSSTSVNPVQNKVIDAEFDAISNAMGALEAAIDEKSNVGHNHDDRYYTETEIDTKLLTVNTSISNITSGTTVVKEAEHATSADSATSADNAIKATKDAYGNVITETYETKTDAVTKLEEAKTYTDTAISSITTITFDEIDAICGAVTEGSLLETDVDELMAQLED